jgi:hypothetical protein
MDAKQLALTEDEQTAVFDRHGHELRPRRRTIFQLVVIEGRSHQHVVDLGIARTLGASRVELTRARVDLSELALKHKELDPLLIERYFSCLSVFDSEHRIGEEDE